MGLFDDIEKQGEGLLKRPETRAKIEAIAKEHGMSLMDAKQHYLRQQGAAGTQ